MGIIKDPTSWRAGFELGLAGFSFPYSKPRKPTAYLYNGIRLPALPEWDRGVYPYAVIVESGLTSHYFFVVAGAPFVWSGTYKSGYSAPASGVKYSIYKPNLTDASAWEILETFKSEVKLSHCYGNTAAWADHDVLNTDGTLYLAASEPVPIYE